MDFEGIIISPDGKVSFKLMGFVGNVLWFAWWQHGLAVCLEIGHCTWLSETASSSAMLGWAGPASTAVFPLAMVKLKFLRST